MMATLANAQIADKDSPFDSGAAYLLAQKCDVNEIIAISPDREVEVLKNNPYVIARIKGATTATDAFNESHEVVQQALDLLSVQGKAYLSTRNALDENLIWWREPSGQVLRVVSVFNWSVTVGGPIEIIETDKDGNVVPRTAPPQVIYHESFRYFRLSQVTDDLFDAFRNMYLAFESLLEYVAPRLKSESEGRWLRRALRIANSRIPLIGVFAPTTSDVVADIYKQIYVYIRCAIFHSKTSPRLLPLLPQNLSDRKIVGEGLIKLTRLVLLIAENCLHARHHTGRLTYDGFSMMTKPMLQTSTILVSDSDEPPDKADTLDSPAYRGALEMKTGPAPDLSEPGLNFILGTIDKAALHALTRIARFGVKSNNKLLMTTTIEAELKHAGIDRLEAQLGIQLRNVREPKHLYKA
ncbi:MAG: hypothetical protein ABSF88_14150 [Candidatus Aminicenantales bacterium]